MTFKIAWNEAVLSIIHCVLDSKVIWICVGGLLQLVLNVFDYSVGFSPPCVLAWHEWRIVHTVHRAAPQSMSSVHKVCEVCKNDAYSPHQIQHFCKSVNLHNILKLMTILKIYVIFLHVHVFSPGDNYTPTVPSELPLVKWDLSEEVSPSCFEKNYKILIKQKYIRYVYHSQ